MLPSRYQGLGMPNFVVDCFAAKVFFVQCKWDLACSSGQLMVHAFEAMLVEVGLYGNLLTRDYDSFANLATSGTWWKNFWEYADYLGIDVELSSDYCLSAVRLRDRSIMDLFSEAGFTGVVGERLNRMRHYKCVVHASDLVSCDGKTIEPAMLDDMPGESSTTTFPDESPTRADFKLWNDCLRAVSSAAYVFPQPLGAKVAAGHMYHRWFIAADEVELYYRYSDAGTAMHSVFEKLPMPYPTRYGQQYKWTENRTDDPPMHTHASIREVNDSTVSLHSTLAAFVPPTPTTNFWDILKSYPNQSMWKYFYCDGDGSWIYQGMLMGTLLIGHDGSYMSEVATDVCSAGFYIFCSASGNVCKGAAAERSANADNYRAEMLGGLMVQLVLRAASQLGPAAFRPVRIDCDNQGVVNHGNTPTRPLKVKQAQADLLRCLKHQVQMNPFRSLFHWVPSHQDDKKKWHQLTLREKINVLVDRLAKLVLLTAIAENEFMDSEFPFEQIRVKIDGKKVTGSPRTAMMAYWSKRIARSFFHDKHIIDWATVQSADTIAVLRNGAVVEQGALS